MKYIPQLFDRLRYVLKKYSILLIAKPPTKLENQVHRKVDPTDKYDKSGIYIFPLKSTVV